MSALKIAFYGKGGIGKSTVATNVSALLAAKGLKVLHIGCDPKADSTRLLTTKKLPTVLQQLDSMEKVRREDLIFPGKFGVECVETGGPEAGCGCAGLGIITAMEELQQLDVFDEAWDIIVYDVLGDVVCGGFSAPMRQHYVDLVFVVTSATYMSLYAANNILKGIKRYSTKGKQLCGGLIGNHIQGPVAERMLKSFCLGVEVPLLVQLEDSLAVEKADYQRKLFALENSEENNAKALQAFVDQLVAGVETVNPRPMQAAELESFVESMGKLLYEE